jgi:hypothetical protein
VHLAGCPRGNDALDKAGGLALLSGRPYAVRPAPRAPAVAAGAARSDFGLQSRLRRVAEEAMRERLAALGPVQAGDAADYLGFGPVTVLEVVGERAYVQFQRSPARMWAPLTQIRKKAR